MFIVNSPNIISQHNYAVDGPQSQKKRCVEIRNRCFFSVFLSSNVEGGVVGLVVKLRVELFYFLFSFFGNLTPNICRT